MPYQHPSVAVTVLNCDLWVLPLEGCTASHMLLPSGHGLRFGGCALACGRVFIRWIVVVWPQKERCTNRYHITAFRPAPVARAGPSYSWLARYILLSRQNTLTDLVACPQEDNCKRCVLPASASRARSVCGSTASSRAGQVAIQAWTGLAPRGKGKAMHRTRSESWSQQTGPAAGPCLGWLVEGRLAWVVAGWAGPQTLG